LKKRRWQHRRVRENVPDGRSGETVHTQELPCRRKQTAAIRHNGGSINFEKRNTMSSFIANPHNERYAFYAGKGDVLKNAEANRGGGAVALTPYPVFESVTDSSAQKVRR